MAKKKVSKVLRKTLQIPIYDASMLLIVGSSFEEATEYAEKLYNIKYEYIDISSLECPACTFSKGKHSILWLSEREIDPGTVAHECLHIAWSILESSGIPVKSDSEETIAYLLGFITVWVSKALAI